ncbi:hypothetical protein E2562_019526 [Oryza meyeriana var. granulata]|uniref:Uncharacterized protein n=1 Tax=Oryza meyeriana var. granulata TaxID=110450 RepID=A0A6G1CH89_9ORYZ|nr:hypothetical protein E2562_019526 [Oryza meyeriana var. granulata]
MKDNLKLLYLLANLLHDFYAHSSHRPVPPRVHSTSYNASPRRTPTHTPAHTAPLRPPSTITAAAAAEYTTIPAAPETCVTTLPNGLRVATESSLAVRTAIYAPARPRPLDPARHWPLGRHPRRRRHVYLVQGFYIVTYSLGIYLLIGFLSPMVDPEAQAAADGPALPTCGSDEFKSFIRCLPEYKFWFNLPCDNFYAHSSHRPVPPRVHSTSYNASPRRTPTHTPAHTAPLRPPSTITAAAAAEYTTILAAPETCVTTLPNGLRVATESSLAVRTAIYAPARPRPLDPARHWPLGRHPRRRRHVYLVQGFYIVTYSLGIYLLIGFLSPMVDPEAQAAADGPALPTCGSDEFKSFIRCLPEYKFWQCSKSANGQ